MYMSIYIYIYIVSSPACVILRIREACVLQCNPYLREGMCMCVWVKSSLSSGPAWHCAASCPGRHYQCGINKGTKGSGHTHTSWTAFSQASWSHWWFPVCLHCLSIHLFIYLSMTYLFWIIILSPFPPLFFSIDPLAPLPPLSLVIEAVSQSSCSSLLPSQL